MVGMGESLSVFDAWSDPDGVAATAALGTVDPAHAPALAAVETTALSDTGRTDMLVAVSAQVAFWQGRLQRVLVSVARAHPVTDTELLEELDPVPGEATLHADDGAVMQTSCALRLSLRAARQRLADAVELVDRLPAMLGLVESGQVGLGHALALVDATRDLSQRDAFDIETRVLGRAPVQSPGSFRRAVSRARAAVIPPSSVEDQMQDAFDRRAVRFSDAHTSDSPGMGTVFASLSAVDAQALKQALTGMGRRHIAEDRAAQRADPAADLGVRTMDQARADALAALAHAALTDPDLPALQGRRPRVQVTVALSTLLGLDEQPGELAGYGQIPATLARRIAADPSGTWHRLVTDDLGTRLLDYGRTVYRPPQDLVDLVTARDQVCQSPHCHRPANESDLDHRLAYGRGGDTSELNTEPGCRPHHRIKTLFGWTVTREPQSVQVLAGPEPPHQLVQTEPILIATADGYVQAERPVLDDRGRHVPRPSAPLSGPDAEARSGTEGSSGADPSTGGDDQRRAASRHVVRVRAAGRQTVWTAPTGHRYRPSRPSFPADTTHAAATVAAAGPELGPPPF